MHWYLNTLIIFTRKNIRKGQSLKKKMKNILTSNSLPLNLRAAKGVSSPILKVGVNKSSSQTLNLKRISIPNITGNTDSLPLISHLPLQTTSGENFFDSKKETTGMTENNMRIATKLIANFFSPVRALASKPVFNIISDNLSSTIKGLLPFSNNLSVVSENSTSLLVSPSNAIFTSSEKSIAMLNSEKKDDNLKVVINLFYFITNKNQALSDSTINSLGSVLTKLFGHPVELRLVRLHYPYLNSHILAQYVAINTKKYNFTRIQRAIFGALLLPRPESIASSHLLTLSEGNGTTSLLTTRSLPSHITGIMIRISGRLVTQRSIPRQTVQTAHIGTFSHSKGIKNVIESASLTCKNKKGAFTVKVWISQLPSLQ